MVRGAVSCGWLRAWVQTLVMRDGLGAWITGVARAALQTLACEVLDGCAAEAACPRKRRVIGSV